MAPIRHLPYELYAQIASDERLSRPDVIAMRLACKAMAAPAASVLFRRIKMSRLRADKDSFEHIAAAEHLAQHVHELVWHELDLEALNVPVEIEPPSQCLPDDDYTLVRDLMAGAARDTSLFWFPQTPLEDYQNFVSSSVGWFITTLDKFPRLTTFYSSPMPQHRVITYKEYPISLDLYRRQSQSRSQTGNSGFFCYMLEAMKRVESNVQSLFYQKENVNMGSFGNELLPKHIDAFRALTTIDLRLSLLNSKEQVDMIVLCLKAAKNLKHLSLRNGSMPPVRKCPLFSALTKSCDWTTLTCLELSLITFSKHPIVRFLERCASVRRLVLRECYVTPDDILKLREMSPCPLTSIIITDSIDYPPESCYLKSSVVEFVSRRSSEIRNSMGEFESISVISGSDDNICTVDNLMPLDEYGDPKYDSKDDSEDDPKDYWEEPYWTWGRFGPRGDVYCWQVDDDMEAQAETTTWSYPNRDDLTVRGDPLEYFSDWDSEAGEEAIPEPDGDELDAFCRSCDYRNEFNTPSSDFWKRVESITWKEPPPEAILYHKC